MLKTIEAVYDGKAFLPEEPLELEANTRVRLVVETLPLGCTWTAHRTGLFAWMTTFIVNLVPMGFRPLLLE